MCAGKGWMENRSWAKQQLIDVYVRQHFSMGTGGKGGGLKSHKISSDNVTP